MLKKAADESAMTLRGGRLAGPTAEDNPRVELTAFDKDGIRKHVLTLTRNSFGSHFADVAAEVKD